MARNFDVNLYPVGGALGFYLLYRFHYSNEMTDIDFCDNSAWFNIKLLSIFNSQDNTKIMKDKTYAAAVKNVCKKENIPTAHYVHIGRVLGSFECELNEDPREEISNLGNWGLNVQETRYSTKIPLGIIRSKAHLKKSINWNPRVGLPVPQVLRDAVFPWLKTAQDNFNADTSRNSTCATA